MPEYQIPLDVPLSDYLAEEFAKRVFFADEAITDFSFVRDGDHVVAVVIITANAVTTEELTRKVGIILHDEVMSLPVRQREVIWRSRSSGHISGNVFDQLKQQGTVYQVGEGQMVLGGRWFLDLLDSIDSLIQVLATEYFNAQEFRYPTLIPSKALQRCGYLTRSPQYVRFTTRLRGDVDTHRAFSAYAQDTLYLGREVFDQCGAPDYCLSPTMCLHTFHQFSDGMLSARVSAVTSRGKAFRHESKNHRTLPVLWDPTVREVVFLGSRDFVLTARRRFLRQMLEMVDMLGLAGRCQVAQAIAAGAADSDPAPPSRRLLEPGYELHLEVAEGDTVVVASFNFHERLFGESFAIATPDDVAAHTACVEFCLENLAFAFVSRYGTKVARWPAPVKYALRAPAQTANRTIGNGE